MSNQLNAAFMKLTKRAEMSDRSKLVATFVDVGPLFTLLKSVDHQIIYGRRGTGKTHALSYLADTLHRTGDATVYLDMRTVGSTGGLYSDTSIPITQRATRLLVDSLSAIHESLFQYFIELAEELDLSITGPLLDQFADAITQVQVIGSIEKEEISSESSDKSYTSEAELSFDIKYIGLKLSTSDEDKLKRQTDQRIKESGTMEHRIHFGALGQIFRRLSDALKNKRVWILLDEWSSIPIELQPYLADLLRRSAFPVRNFTVKIAAIEQRSRFRIVGAKGDYLGVELGADISADINLDDFMVFDNNDEAAKAFFQELLYKHVKETEEPDIKLNISSTDDLIRQAFTQRNTFDEFVRAIEGVPRDAINIISLAAQKAFDNTISISHINTATHNWFQRDKEAAVKSDHEAHTLLHWIIDKVIGERRARAFLLRSDIDHELIDTLFDARVLHVLKRNVSAHDQPGIRYDVYVLDYGCYVDLKGTQRFPEGLLPTDSKTGNDTFIEVPPDDYRSIRRAILDLNEFLGREASSTFSGIHK